jgi:transcriptional regulator with XRE-family HTH domain
MGGAKEMTVLGRNIKKYRELKGLTQDQVAKMVGKSKNVVSNWEQGRNKPDADTIEILMGIFDVDANTLLGWDSPKQIVNDAQELVDLFMSDPEVKEIALSATKLSKEDLKLAKSFIDRLVKEDK